MHKSFVIILLATVALALMGPAVSGISLLQEVKAEISDQPTNSSAINKQIPPPVESLILNQAASQNTLSTLANATTQIHGFSDHIASLANLGIPLTGSMAMSIAIGFIKA